MASHAYKPLLSPHESVLVLIDHQPRMMAGDTPGEREVLCNNVAGLARTANAFGVPTVLTGLAALRCPTTFVVGHGELPGAAGRQDRAIRAAVAKAAALNGHVTVFGTTGREHTRVLTRDARLVAAAIEDVTRRSHRPPGR